MIAGDQLADCAAQALALEPHLVSAYLFGSHASGRAHRDSDIDIGVLFRWSGLPTSRARFDARIRVMGDLAHALGTNAVDLVVLNDAPPLLARAIVTRGRRVLCLDAEDDRAFVRDAQLRAADIEPFLRRTRRLKLDALAGR